MEIRLQWADASTRIDGYKIERSSAGGAWVEMVRVGGGTTAYHDLRLVPETQYRYRVRAYEILLGRDHDSAYSTEASVKTPAAVTATAPAAPTATALGPDRIRLDWQDQSSNETGFRVHRRSKGTDYALVADLPPNTQSFLDTGLEPATTYTYMVGAYHVTQEGKTYSPHEGQVLATTTAPSSLAVPANLAAAPIGENDVRLSWSYALPTGIRFNIERQGGGVAVKLYEKLSGNTAVPGGNPFADTGNPDILEAYALGIVKGVSPTQFAPSNNITRQEMCVMIYRALQAAGENTTLPSGCTFPFSDASQTAAWAINEVRFCYANGIMKGTSQTTISPLVNTPREQAIVLIFRTFEAFK